MNEKIRVFEAFAGIGAQRKALENIGKNFFRISGLAEWNVPSIIMYEAIHNNLSLDSINKNIKRKEMENYLESIPLSWDSKNIISKNYWKKKSLDVLRISYLAVKNSEKSGNIFDVRLLWKRTLKDIDLLTYSFPCQDLSQQGNQKGINKKLSTRSGLLWEIEKALDYTNKIDLPKYLLMENVPALLHKKHEKEFKKWKEKLKKLGYFNSFGVLNSSDFGSAQVRRRVFMISSLEKKIDLPKGSAGNKKNLKNILEEKPKKNDMLPALSKYDLSDFSVTKSNIKKASLLNYTSFNSESYVYDPNFLGPTLTASGANSRIKILYKNKIRKMNSLEAFRYMGFTDNDYKNINNLNIMSENQKIFVCGNSISIEVLEKIMKEFIKNEKW